MAVAFADFEFAVSAMRERAGNKFAGPRAEAHGTTHFVDAEKFAEFVNDTVRRLRIAFRGVGLLQAGNIASVLDGGALHAEAHTEVGHFVFARVLDGVDHALHAAFAETAGNKDAVVAVQSCGGGFW